MSLILNIYKFIKLINYLEVIRVLFVISITNYHCVNSAMYKVYYAQCYTVLHALLNYYNFVLSLIIWLIKSKIYKYNIILYIYIFINTYIRILLVTEWKKEIPNVVYISYLMNLAKIFQEICPIHIIKISFRQPILLCFFYLIIMFYHTSYEKINNGKPK